MAKISSLTEQLANPDHSSNIGPSIREEQDIRRFDAICAQLKYERIAPFVSSIRQHNEFLKKKTSASASIPPLFDCKVLPNPSCGSYNIAYHVVFEDGVEWILKIPVSGHHACFDGLAADSLTSEALTMRMIKKRTTIPIPTVHAFDTSAKNLIGCPFILMDFLKGKPVWQGWFDQEASSSKLEQFRARCLQTIAMAMVQLSPFTTYYGGSLRFSSDGSPVTVAGAKVPDWLAEQEVMQGIKAMDETRPYCAKGPIADPASSFLFMLNRRGVREQDAAFDRGIHEAVRLFTQWTLEKSGVVHDQEQQFVLAHPDFALQNFLVEDDGTLCGIIDWDGVAAVPTSVGCLKYPDWLMGDWNPEYDYCPGDLAQQQNSPEELATYRNIYAQFIEAFSSMTCGSIKKGKLYANITRMSLVAGSLNLGAQDLKLTDDTVDIIFGKLAALVASDDDDNVSDSGPDFSIGTDTDGFEGDNSNRDTTPTELEQSTPGDTDEINAESLGLKCIAELRSDQSSVMVASERSHDAKSSTLNAICSDGHGTEYECNEAHFSSGVHSGKIARDPKTSTICPGTKTSCTTRMVKWALDRGEKACRGASEALHKKNAESRLQSKNETKTLPTQVDSGSVSKFVKEVAIDLCKRVETFLRRVATRLHQDSTRQSDRSSSQQTRVEHFQMLLEWLVIMCEKLVQKPVKDGLNGVRVPPAVEESVPENTILADQERCQRRNHYKAKSGREEGEQSSETGSEDVWATIAAEVHNGGIPLDMIKKRRDVIVQSIIQNLAKEIQLEKEHHLESKRAKATVWSTQDSANMNDTSRASVNVRSAVIAPKLTRPGSAIFMTDKEKAQEMESIGGEEFEATDGTGRGSAISSAEHSRSGTLEPDRIRISDDARESSEPESLLSKLEAAKRRSELGMVSKTQNSRPTVSGVVAAPFDAAKSRAHDVLTLDATEETNRKLRTILSSFAKPKTANNPSVSNVFQASEDRGAAVEQIGCAELEDLKQSNITLGRIEAADENSRTMLASTQGPGTFEMRVRQNMAKVAKVENKETDGSEASQTLSSVSISDASYNHGTEQPRTAVKGGQWFETPRGSLRRVQNENEVDVAFEEHEVEVSPPDDDDGQRDELEDGEIDEDARSSIGDHLSSESKGNPGEKAKEGQVKKKPKAGEVVDSGYFAFGDVCVALGNGNLDERRMMRLKEGFMALLDDTIGIDYRPSQGTNFRYV